MLSQILLANNQELQAFSETKFHEKHVRAQFSKEKIVYRGIGDKIDNYFMKNGQI